MEDESLYIERYRKRLDNAASYSEVWEIVRDTVEFALHKRRAGMLLFLDDLPIQLGAYHPLGTNNIVLNRMLVQIAEAENEPKNAVNALIYNLLVHEYMHALGEVSEVAVREMVIKVAEKCFGKDYIAAQVAVKSPWTLLKRIPLQALNMPRRVMEIVKDFERTDRYVV
jgi:diketogulonate reductase-like aldo/keto reductase